MAPAKADSPQQVPSAHNYIAVLEDPPASIVSQAAPASRYHVSSSTVDAMYGATLSNVFPDVSKQNTARDVRELRETFDAGLTFELKQRRELLLQLQRMMKEGEADIKQALWKDLHKNPVESYVTELSVTYAELQEHLDYLETWAKPQMVATNIANLPGLSYIHRDPLGVVCVIGTWNYPINLLITPLISALAAGNCAVVRLPGDDSTRYVNNVLISLFDKYVDKRFVRYVYGGVEETKAMLRERYDLIFATGGCFLGKIVARAAAEHLTPTVLELGGKSPGIVDETVDIALAARRLTWGAFTNSGQTCVRPDYLLVDERVGDKLIAAMEKQIVAFYGKDAKTSDSYGRVVNERSYQRLAAKLKADTSRVTFGGETDPSELYISPTLFNFKTDLQAFTSSAVMADELFGPLLPIFYYPAGQLQWAIDFVKSHDKPLALYLYSTSTANKTMVARKTTSGSMVVNDSMTQLANAHLPFGGVGTSGMGSYHGKHGFDTFSHKKSVLYKYSLLDLAQRYAPYTSTAEKVMRIVLYPLSRLQMRIAKFVLFAIAIAIIALVIKASV